MFIEYIGNKPCKEDNVAGTGIVWFGAGDKQEVADEIAAKKLLAHANVWREAQAEEATSKASEKDVTNQRYVLDGPNGAVVLDDMNDAALRSWASVHLEPSGIKIDGRKKGDGLRQAIVDAVTAAGA